MTNQTVTELKQQLSDQIGFLKSSAKEFDCGAEVESKRLAAIIRLLVHDTKQQTSLLALLGTKATLQFWNSALPLKPYATSSQFSLVYQCISPTDGARFVAPLDDCVEPGRWVDFETWWQTPVIVDGEQNRISRKEIVLWLADKDGGVHVDSKLPPVYAGLSRHNSLGWVQRKDSDGDASVGPVIGVERAAMRQIAHEILKTLVPGYTMKPVLLNDGMLIGASSVTVSSQQGGASRGALGVTFGSSPATPERPARIAAKVGRNDSCTCGSGKKYKKCHGAPASDD